MTGYFFKRPLTDWREVSPGIDSQAGSMTGPVNASAMEPAMRAQMSDAFAAFLGFIGQDLSTAL
jgi:hypothetical protein